MRVHWVTVQGPGNYFSQEIFHCFKTKLGKLVQRHPTGVTETLGKAFIQQAEMFENVALHQLEVQRVRFDHTH